MTGAGVRVGVAAAVALVLVVVPTEPAAAHPSDFETLTLDLLIGPDGLEAVDAAVVQGSGPEYYPFPSTTLKRDVAGTVLQVLQIPTRGVEIDARVSPRYHEVGFHIRFSDPTLAGTAPLSVDTRALQKLAYSHGMEQLKISVCGVTEDGQRADLDVRDDLEIRADRPGRAPTGQDRFACRVWPLDHQDASFSIVVFPQQLAETGLATSHMLWLATLVTLLGCAVRGVGRSDP